MTGMKIQGRPLGPLKGDADFLDYVARGTKYRRYPANDRTRDHIAARIACEISELLQAIEKEWSKGKLSDGYFALDISGGTRTVYSRPGEATPLILEAGDVCWYLGQLAKEIINRLDSMVKPSIVSFYHGLAITPFATISQEKHLTAAMKKFLDVSPVLEDVKRLIQAIIEFTKDQTERQEVFTRLQLGAAQLMAAETFSRKWQDWTAEELADSITENDHPLCRLNSIAGLLLAIYWLTLTEHCPLEVMLNANLYKLENRYNSELNRSEQVMYRKPRQLSFSLYLAQQLFGQPGEMPSKVSYFTRRATYARQNNLRHGDKVEVRFSRPAEISLSGKAPGSFEIVGRGFGPKTVAPGYVFATADSLTTELSSEHPGERVYKVTLHGLSYLASPELKATAPVK
jgi:hypothetical protein